MSGALAMAKRRSLWLLALLPHLMLCLCTQLRFPMLGDEVHFHLPSILSVREGLRGSMPLPELMVSYKAANGPLPYLAFSAWGGILGFEPERLRMFSAICAAGTLLLFFALLEELSSPKPVVYCWLFFSWPYFFLYSNTLLVHSIYLFFLTSAVFAFYRGLVATRAVIFWLLLGTVSSALALATRQTSLPIVAALSIYVIVRSTYMKKHKVVWMSFLSLVVFAGLFMCLTLAWGGLVPPAFQSGHQVAVSHEVIFLFGISVAVFFAPLIPLAWNIRNVLLISAVTGGMYALQIHTGTASKVLPTSKGVVPLAFEIAGHTLGDIPVAIVGVILASLGLVVAWRIVAVEQFHAFGLVLRRNPMQTRDELAVILMVTTIASLPAALLTSYLYELYLMTTYPWMLALSSRIKVPKRSLLIWLGVQVAVAIAYFWVKAYWGIG